MLSQIEAICEFRLSVLELSIVKGISPTLVGGNGFIILRDCRTCGISTSVAPQLPIVVWRDLPKLETISLAMTHITDEGVVHLASCDALEQVNLS